MPDLPIQAEEHSTGSGNAINQRTGKPPALCRGARDIQLKVFTAMRVIEAPTDEAWAKKWAQVSKSNES